MIRNLVEDHVRDAYDALRPQLSRFLRLRDLPRGRAGLRAQPVPPRYVGDAEGTVVTEVNLDKDQNRAAIEVAVMEAHPQGHSGAARCRRKRQRPDRSRGEAAARQYLLTLVYGAGLATGLSRFGAGWTRDSAPWLGSSRSLLR